VNGAGLVITSSHNPLEWNGLKFIVDGRGINERELPTILEHSKNKEGPKVGLERNCATTYVDDAVRIIGEAEGSPRIAVDIGGGAARDYAPRLLERIGCRTTIINGDLQSCTRGPDPTADRLLDLVGASTKMDMGFAFDLDGDRLVIVSDGVKETPDATLGLGVAGALETGCRSFVLSTDTSIAVERLIRDGGGRCTRSKVGEANVVDAMIGSGAQAGGEGSSGGFILSEFNYCRDGMLASGLISAMIHGSDSRLDEVLQSLRQSCMIRTKVQAAPDTHDGIVERADAWLHSNCSEVDRLDGIKGIIDEHSWVLIRRSNTEDAVRISAESDGRDRCERIVKDVTAAIMPDDRHASSIPAG